VKPMHGAFAGLALAALLLGCSVVRSNVTRFDQLPGDTAGRSVYFLPVENQDTSSAYRTYASRVAAELAKHGMRRSDDISTADYSLTMTYGVGAKRQIVREVPLYNRSGNFMTPIGAMPYTQTVYDRYFTIRMIDLERSTPQNPVTVYEGRVASTGEADSFDQVADCMILALFQNFRGSGATRVDINANECP
jgi:hypothetical protein